MKKFALPFLALVSFIPQAMADDPYEPAYTPGNLSYFPTSNSLIINSTTGAYYRFTATETTTANSLHININSSSLTATSLTFGLQADDGNGLPSGTFLLQGTVTPTAGWNSLTFETGAALTAGQVYHVVMQPAEGGTAYLRRAITAGPVTAQSFGILDPNYARAGIPNNVPSTPSNADASVFAVGTTSGRGMGLAYSGNSLTTLSPTAPSAQRFQFHASAPDEVLLESITLRLGVDAAVLRENLRDIQVTLLSDTNLVLGSVTLDADDLAIGGSPLDYTISFGNDIELTDGAYYRLAVNATGAGSASARWYLATTSSSDSAINSATFQGLDGYLFSYTNTLFEATTGIQTGQDYLFSYTTTAIPEPGATACLFSGLAVGGLVLRRRRRTGPATR